MLLANMQAKHCQRAHRLWFARAFNWALALLVAWQPSARSRVLPLPSEAFVLPQTTCLLAGHKRNAAVVCYQGLVCPRFLLPLRVEVLSV